MHRVITEYVLFFWALFYTNLEGDLDIVLLGLSGATADQLEIVFSGKFEFRLWIHDCCSRVRRFRDLQLSVGPHGGNGLGCYNIR